MLAANFIVEPLECPAGLMNMEFPVTVQIDAVELNMAVDMRLVRVCCHNELMLSIGKLHCQFAGDLVCLLRCDLTGFEGLNDTVYENIPTLGLIPPGQVVI